MAERVQCSVHGEGWETYVCDHLKGDAFGLGFNREEPTFETPYPDAFCDECEKIYREQGKWNETTKRRIKIRLLCSSCYERARIRNTRTKFTLEHLAGFRWKCTSCEEWHRGACLDITQDEPYYWSKDYEPGEVDCEAAALSDLPKTFLNSDFCSINGSDFFVRGLIELPIIGTNETFRWGVWGSLSRDSFEQFLRTYDDASRTELPKMFSWLSSKLPDYPDTLNLKMYAHIRDGEDRPYFELEKTEHPLSREFHEGASAERIQEIMMNNVLDMEQEKPS